MKPKSRLHIAWVLFALAMAGSELISDFPRVFHPHRTVDPLMGLANATAVLGLAFYAFRLNGSRGFWRLYAPLYAIVMAVFLGKSLVPLARILDAMFALGGSTPIVFLGALAVTVPIWAMLAFTLVALFRLGDWIGPTRRPVGARQQQLTLPL